MQGSTSLHLAGFFSVVDRETLHCGILDADSFIELAEQYELDLFTLVDELHDMGIKHIGINYLIYIALKTINEYFLSYVVHAKRARHFTSVEYQIFTNCLDSSA